MTASWLIVKWVVAGTAGLCVGALLIVWMIEGTDFVCERPGQKIIFAFLIANSLSQGFIGTFGSVVFSRLCFVLAGLVYAGIGIVLLMDLAKKLRVLVRADS
jgi:hypothetical protein